MSLPGRIAVAVSVTAGLALGCGAARAGGQGMPQAPNEVHLAARGVSARLADAASLKIEPPQSVCVVTLRVDEVLKVMGPVAAPPVDRDLEVLARDVECAAPIVGRPLRVVVSQRRAGTNPARWWWVRRLEE